MATGVEPSPRRLSYVLDEWSMPRWVAKALVTGPLLDVSTVPVWWWHVDCICILQ